MNDDTGAAELAVISDLTVSIGFLKTGLLTGRADELIGRLVNVDIGIRLPEDNIEKNK
jgi:NAD(P)H-hydrate epimerase